MIVETIDTLAPTFSSFQWKTLVQGNRKFREEKGEGETIAQLANSQVGQLSRVIVRSVRARRRANAT